MSYRFTIFTDKNQDTLSNAHSYDIHQGQTLLKNFMIHQITTRAQCGGKAICGACRIKVLSGSEFCSQPMSAEKNRLTRAELSEGWRLSCQLYCLNDISIYLPQ
jgi:ferredoxin